MIEKRDKKKIKILRNLVSAAEKVHGSNSQRVFNLRGFNEAHTSIFPRPKYLHLAFDIAIFQISNFPPYLVLLFYYIGVHSLLYACIDVVNPLTTYDCHLSFEITM